MEFEETPNEKVSNMSKLTKSYFSIYCITHFEIPWNETRLYKKSLDKQDSFFQLLLWYVYEVLRIKMTHSKTEIRTKKISLEFVDMNIWLYLRGPSSSWFDVSLWKSNKAILLINSNRVLHFRNPCPFEKIEKKKCSSNSSI